MSQQTFKWTSPGRACYHRCSLMLCQVQRGSLAPSMLSHSSYKFHTTMRSSIKIKCTRQQLHFDDLAFVRMTWALLCVIRRRGDAALNGRNFAQCSSGDRFIDLRLSTPATLLPVEWCTEKASEELAQIYVVLEKRAEETSTPPQHNEVTYLADTLSSPDILVSTPPSGVDSSDPPCEPSVKETLFFELTCLEDLGAFDSSPPSPSLDVPLFFPFDPFLLETPPPFGFAARLWEEEGGDDEDAAGLLFNKESSSAWEINLPKLFSYISSCLFCPIRLTSQRGFGDVPSVRSCANLPLTTESPR